MNALSFFSKAGYKQQKTYRLFIYYSRNGEHMVEIIHVYKQNVDPQRFIGKKYDNANRANGTFGVKVKWTEWFENSWFETIENQTDGNQEHKTYEDGGAYIGLSRNKSGEPFQYWIGMFVPMNTEIPEGYDYIDFPKSELGVCWVYGKEEHVYMSESTDILDQCNNKLKENGMFHVHDKNNTCWAFERYTRSRSKAPDEKGNIILDICFYMNFHY